MDFSQELEKWKKDFDSEEKKLNAKLAAAIKQAEQKIKKDIENESIYRRNCLDIAIVKVRHELEQEIDKINKERYKDLGTVEEDADTKSQKTSEEPQKPSPEPHPDFEDEVEKERQAFELESRARRIRFDTQMQSFLNMQFRDTKEISKLKKEVVPIVSAQGMIKMADETLLETRYSIKITRNAVRTGPAWALYKAQFKDKPVLCRITVLMKVPMEIRRYLNSSAKCIRFLCEKPAHPAFVKLYEIFYTEQKMYFFMDEHLPNNLAHAIARGKVSEQEVQKWSGQLKDAYAFMHNYAIAHLDIKSENVIFDKALNAKVIGLSRAFLYFNLDQETIIKAPQVDNTAYNDHLPVECFETDFSPQPADMFSFGLLIYEMSTKSNPMRNEKDPAKRGENWRLNAMNNFNFSKIGNAKLGMILERMVNISLISRPKFTELNIYDYFKDNSSVASQASQEE